MKKNETTQISEPQDALAFGWIVDIPDRAIRLKGDIQDFDFEEDEAGSDNGFLNREGVFELKEGEAELEEEGLLAEAFHN